MSQILGEKNQIQIKALLTRPPKVKCTFLSRDRDAIEKTDKHVL